MAANNNKSNNTINIKNRKATFDYEIIENGWDRIVVIDLMDDDEPEITMEIGHASSTMWVAAVR